MSAVSKSACVVLGLIVLAGNEAEAGIARQEANGLSVEVEFDEVEHLVAQPVMIRCSLANQTKQPIHLSWEGLELQFENELGDSVPTGRLAVPFNLAPAPVAVTIDPGERRLRVLNLLTRVSFVRAGTYHATLKISGDGKYCRPAPLNEKGQATFEMLEGWTGAISVRFGPIRVVEPERPEDKSALEDIWAVAPVGKGRDVPLQLSFALLGESGDMVLTDHPESTYAAYIRAREVISMASKHDDEVSWEVAAEAVLRRTRAIDSSPFPSVHRSQVELASIKGLCGSGQHSEALAALREFGERHGIDLGSIGEGDLIGKCLQSLLERDEGVELVPE